MFPSWHDTVSYYFLSHYTNCNTPFLLYYIQAGHCIFLAIIINIFLIIATHIFPCNIYKLDTAFSICFPCVIHIYRPFLWNSFVLTAWNIFFELVWQFLIFFVGYLLMHHTFPLVVFRQAGRCIILPISHTIFWYIMISAICLNIFWVIWAKWHVSN